MSYEIAREDKDFISHVEHILNQLEHLSYGMIESPKSYIDFGKEFLVAIQELIYDIKTELTGRTYATDDVLKMFNDSISALRGTEYNIDASIAAVEKCSSILGEALEEIKKMLGMDKKPL